MVYSIQILRGFAALMVFFEHLKGFGYLPKWWIFEGAIGVDLFFVISGFIMAQALCNQKEQGLRASSEFMFRRIVRIYPVYIIISTAFAFYTGNWPFWKSSLILFPQSDGNGVLKYPFVGAAWTLSFEMLYYFVIASLLYIKKYSVKNSIIVITILFLLSHVVRSSTAIIETIFCPILIEFAFGALINWLYNSSKQILEDQRKKIFFLIITFFMFFIFKHGIANGYKGIYEGMNLQYENATINLPRWVGFGIPSALFLFAFIQYEDFFRTQKKKLMLFVALGNASYCLYLSHEFVINLFMNHFPRSPQEMFLLTTSSAVIFSVIFYYLVENPIINLGKRILKGDLPLIRKLPFFRSS